MRNEKTNHVEGSWKFEVELKDIGALLKAINELSELLRKQNPVHQGSKPELFSVNQAAEFLGISVHTVRNYLTTKRINKTKIGERSMIRRSELEHIVEHGVRGR